MVKCPFGYFLEYVLGIEAPEEIELDRARWLDPLDRGSLIHEILADFMARVVESGERPDPGRHGPLMEEIAQRVIKAWRHRVPPPSPGIFDKERQDIHDALDVFFRVESARAVNVRPFAFEKSFAGVPVDVEGGASFRLKGRIDRIDRTGTDTFRILDYKTGSPKPYEELRAFGKGRVIQHALYAVAVEKVLVLEGLAKEPRVTESGYSFPDAPGRRPRSYGRGVRPAGLPGPPRSHPGPDLERLLRHLSQGRVRVLRFLSRLRGTAPRDQEKDQGQRKGL